MTDVPETYEAREGMCRCHRFIVLNSPIECNKASDELMVRYRRFFNPVYFGVLGTFIK